MTDSVTEEPEFNQKPAYSSSRILRMCIALIMLYAALCFIGSSLVPPVFTISTEEILPASKADSWKVLSDFASYPRWNPYLPNIQGDFEVGEKVTLTLVTPDHPEPRTSEARVAERAPPHQLSWEGSFFIPGIAHTRHVFALEEIDAERTRLLHFEEFRGLAVAAMSAGKWAEQRAAEIENNRAAFSGMNRALAQQLARLSVDTLPTK